jgi:hypothetical protein
MTTPPTLRAHGGPVGERRRQFRRPRHIVDVGEHHDGSAFWPDQHWDSLQLVFPMPQVEPRCELPALHKDPFDRILIAQAKAEGVGLVTSDGALSDYPVQTIW